VKAKLYRVAVLLLFFSFIAIPLAAVNPVAAADPVIVGRWDRTDGYDKYTIYADRTTQTVLPDGTHHGTWELDGTSGYKYIFRWDFGPSGRENFIDYVTVAADGQSYSGVNNYGNNFHCLRIGDAPAVESGGFPIIPVAIGGGIAAVAAIGAAAYYFFIAGKGAAEAGSTASTLSGASGGQPSGNSETLAENSSSSLSTAEAEKRAEIDKLKVELQNMKETLEKMAKTPNPDGTNKADQWQGAQGVNATPTPQHQISDNPVKLMFEKMNMTPEQQLQFIEKVNTLQPLQTSSPQGGFQAPPESELLKPENKEFREMLKNYYNQLKQQMQQSPSDIG
jgi:hypothetical protein